MEMTEKEAMMWASQYTDLDTPDEGEMREAFKGIYERYPEEGEDVWSLICAALPL